MVAVKKLSADSKQGAREFLNEVIVISRVQHRNLVKLRGCCVEKLHRLLVYEYLENRSLRQSLLGEITFVVGFQTCIHFFSWQMFSEIYENLPILRTHYL